MAYFSDSGIFAGMDDTDPVLQGLGELSAVDTAKSLAAAKARAQKIADAVVAYVEISPVFQGSARLKARKWRERLLGHINKSVALMLKQDTLGRYAFELHPQKFKTTASFVRTEVAAAKHSMPLPLKWANGLDDLAQEFAKCAAKVAASGSATVSPVKLVQAEHRPINGFGEFPPGTSESAKARAKKSYYYLYTMATLAPKLRELMGLAVGASVASVVTAGMGLLVGGASAAVAASIANAGLEATMWWAKSKKDRDDYIKRAMLGDDIKKLLRTAAGRMDGAVKGLKTPADRSAARARAYFQDFIAIGANVRLKTLSAAEQTAFGMAYLDCLAVGRSEKDCMDAGVKAAAKAAQAQKKAQAAVAAKAEQARKAEVRRRRQEAVADAKKKRAAADTKKKLALQKLTAIKAQPAAPIAQVKAAEAEVAKAEVEQAQLEAQIVSGEQQVAAALTEEKQAEKTATAIEAEAVAETVATPAEQAAAAEQDSAEDVAADKAAAVVPAAEGKPADGGAEAKPKGGFPVGLAVAAAVGYFVIRGISK